MRRDSATNIALLFFLSSSSFCLSMLPFFGDICTRLWMAMARVEADQKHAITTRRMIHVIFTWSKIIALIVVINRATFAATSISSNSRRPVTVAISDQRPDQHSSTWGASSETMRVVAYRRNVHRRTANESTANSEERWGCLSFGGIFERSTFYIRLFIL